jgi:hypothetical protein
MAHIFDPLKFLWCDLEISHRRFIKPKYAMQAYLRYNIKFRVFSSNKSLSTWKVMIERDFMQPSFSIFAFCGFPNLAFHLPLRLREIPPAILEYRSVGAGTVTLYSGTQTNFLWQFAYFLTDVSATGCWDIHLTLIKNYDLLKIGTVKDKRHFVA